MSLVSGPDGDLVAVKAASTERLLYTLARMRAQRALLAPSGDEHRWVSQEIEIIEDELWAREREEVTDA